MRHFHLQRNHQWAPTLNIEKLWSLVPTEAREKYVSGAKTDSAPVIDLLSHGYAKLLGKGKDTKTLLAWWKGSETLTVFSGRLPAVPIVVRARYVSSEAERKITEAGGVVELVA